MYPQLERLMLQARHSVWMGFRIFDPATKLRSEEGKAAGLADWSALLGHAVARGVDVRILLTDFEPVMADDLHAGSWESFHRLRALSDSLPPEHRDRLQLIVVQHEGEMGWFWRQALRLLLRRHVHRLITKLLGKKGEALGLRPGLWRYLAWEKGEPVRWRPAPPPRLWPATYHQKFVVVDGEKAVVGGLDVDERRWDDRRHRQRADQTWHDISCLLEGPVAGDVAAHFAALWNRELPRFPAIVKEWTDGAARRLTLEPLSPAAPPPLAAELPDGEAAVQLARTWSRRSSSPFALGPLPHVRELRSAHRRLIRSARDTLYIEAQFFRSDEAADWVIEALASSPELEVIILVANAPEEVAFEGQGDNPAHRHGEYLQARALGRILRSGGRERVGLFTLAKQERVRPDEQEFAEQRGEAYGSGLIHIHSKLLIADDRACLLSSANINGRSFEWDTELGVIWVQADGAIADFRRRLWGQLFGEALGDGAGLARWRAVAAENARSGPEDRKGFVVPYQLSRARRFSRAYRFVPDDLV